MVESWLVESWLVEGWLVEGWLVEGWLVEGWLVEIWLAEGSISDNQLSITLSKFVAYSHFTLSYTILFYTGFEFLHTTQKYNRVEIFILIYIMYQYVVQLQL